MPINLELWTVEFSEKQQCFHVSQLRRILTKNLEIFLYPNNANDWSLLAVVDTYEEAHQIAENLRTNRGIPSLFERFEKEHCK